MVEEGVVVIMVIARVVAIITTATTNKKTMNINKKAKTFKDNQTNSKKTTLTIRSSSASFTSTSRTIVTRQWDEYITQSA